ncbi:MAG TPA: trypsin-like peptidase domain-containing protein, partial [Candidatus Sumerlaeota bacterium]|nr:trypsin-like peptidase domain-containing protein [Candidatus Sumerlaeota bacterium]
DQIIDFLPDATFIIDKEGHVLTNYHVVEDASGISVTLTDRRTLRASLMDADRYLDIALLKIEGLASGEQLPFVPMGNSDDIMIGETVLAVGNPFGPLIADPRPSVSVGVVSATSRSFRGDQNGRIYQNMIQTDAAINPGNSGGPLLNLDAEAIGVNTFIFSRSGDSASVGFSIPINRVRRIVEEILEFGRLRAIRMDFETVSLSPPIVQMLDLGVTEGALVRAIDIGGPAERAGLQPKDVITRVDGIDIRDADDLMASFLTRTVGETLDMTVRRDGEELHLKYVIEEGRPPE